MLYKRKYKTLLEPPGLPEPPGLLEGHPDFSNSGAKQLIISHKCISLKRERSQMEHLEINKKIYEGHFFVMHHYASL